MPEVFASSAREWGLLAIAHMNAMGHAALVWHVSRTDEAHRIGCPVCNMWFAITPETLRADMDSRSSVVTDFLRTGWGREQIIRVLIESAAITKGRVKGERDPSADYPFDRPEPEVPRRTAWERVLDDED